MKIIASHLMPYRSLSKSSKRQYNSVWADRSSSERCPNS